MRNHRVLTVLMAMAWWSCIAAAQAQQIADPDTSGPWTFSVGLGGFSPASSDQLSNQSGQASLMLGGGYQVSKNFSIDLDVWGADQRVDTPATILAPSFGTLDGRATISTGALSVVAKLGWPLGRFKPYVGAGGGLFYSKLYVTGSVLGLPARLEETDTDFGGLLLGGIDIRVSQNWVVGAEFRHISVKASFGSVMPGDVEVGGNSVMATLRWSPAGHD